MNRVRHILVLTMLAATACAGSETQTVSGSFENDAAPLPTIERDVWQTALAGCEAQLEGIELQFGIAAGAPELVVAFGEDSVLCVDSYAAVESELDLVDPRRIDSLWLGYVSALQEAEPFSGDYAHSEESDALPAEIAERVRAAQADPHPEPNLVGEGLPDLGVVMADPHPVPNDDPNSEDPMTDNGSQPPAGP